MAIIKKPYELSVWDIYPEEKKIAIIGSDTMSSPAKAMEVKLKSKLNGTVELTFKLLSKFFDVESGHVVDNPFLGLLINERIIKLKYKKKWYDLIIKNIQETSDSKSFIYTATSLHINELSKNGFELEFKTELENNQGTALELGEKIVEGSNWKIDKENSDLIRAFKDEQLYECYLSKDIDAVFMIGKDNQGDIVYEEEKIWIISGTRFYLFYSEYLKWRNDETVNEVQGIYINYEPSENSLDDYILNNNYVDDDGVLTEGRNFLLKTEGLFIDDLKGKKVSNFRGKLLSKQPLTKYNNVLKRYVTVYNNGEVEGFTKTKFLSPTFVQNFFVNGSDFTSTAGWYPVYNNGGSVPDVSIDFYPNVEAFLSNSQIDVSAETRIGIKLTPAKNSGGKVYNTLFRSNASKIEDIQIGDEFLFEYEYAASSEDAFSYKIIEAGENNEKAINCTLKELPDSEKTVYGQSRKRVKIIFDEYISNKRLKKLKFLFILKKSEYPVIFYDVIFCRYVEAIKAGESKPEILYPGDIPDTTPLIENYYYLTESAKEYKEEADYEYLDPNDTYAPVYNSTIGYLKISTINGSESNRFNLIQNICESFECWADFQIEHDDNGRILERKIAFKEYIGRQQYSGFKYGINLQSIQRTLKTDQIVTKTIVKNNSNEYGKNRFCSISRAIDNPSGQNYILNFSYYLNQNLLNREELNKELYGYGITKGFYEKMKEKTLERDRLISELEALSTTLLEAKAAHQTSLEGMTAAEQELAELKMEYKQYCGLEFPNVPSNAIVEGTISDNKIREYITRILTTDKNRVSFEKTYESYKDYTEEYCDNLIEAKNNEIKELGIEKIENDFFEKFQYFIQEGTWLSEDYYDDNLYYLDALDVSRTSSKPQVNYSIKVIDVSVLEGYESYDFQIGDKTYVEDTEFFGWTDVRGIREPYKEEIVVSELMESLDAPEQNTITVQNYKTQFDDLFQRITASTQTLQYASGGYNRAANALLATGELKYEFLQNTILNNGVLLKNSENESVYWDNTGIHIIDPTQPSNMVRLVSKGVLISEDGGETWVTGISGRGINANYITAGQLDVSKIRVMSGTMPAFDWTEKGISAYELRLPDPNDNDLNNQGQWVDTSNFVRFDQYGIYCIQGDKDFLAEDLSSIKSKENVPFYLLRDGSLYISGKVEASSGEIGGWVISTLKNGTKFLASNSSNKPNVMFFSQGSQGTVAESTANSAKGYYIVGYNTERNDWLFLAGSNSSNDLAYNFGVKSNGTLYAMNAKIKGYVEATSGKIGNFELKDGNLITDEFSLTPLGEDSLIGPNIKYFLKLSNLLTIATIGSDENKVGQMILTGAFTSYDGSVSIASFDEINATSAFYPQAFTNGDGSGSITSVGYFYGKIFNTDGDAKVGFTRIVGGNYSGGKYRCGQIVFGTTDGVIADGITSKNNNYQSKITNYDGSLELSAKQGITLWANYNENSEAKLILVPTKDGNGNVVGSGQLEGTWYQKEGSAITSDIKEKNSVESIQNSYSLLFDELKPIRYKYNNNNSNRYHIGFIAQEVEAAISKASLSNQDFAGFVRNCKTEIDPITNEEFQVERCYLRYEEFIALNTNEIQKLKKRVAELESQIAELTTLKN